MEGFAEAAALEEAGGFSFGGFVDAAVEVAGYPLLGAVAVVVVASREDEEVEAVGDEDLPVVVNGEDAFRPTASLRVAGVELVEQQVGRLSLNGAFQVAVCQASRIVGPLSEFVLRHIGVQFPDMFISHLPEALVTHGAKFIFLHGAVQLADNTFIVRR